jgi:hypothetical protein
MAEDRDLGYPVTYIEVPESTCPYHPCPLCEQAHQARIAEGNPPRRRWPYCIGPRRGRRAKIAAWAVRQTNRWVLQIEEAERK